MPAMLPLKDNIPTRQTPVVTLGLIGANVLVWLWELRQRSTEIEHYAFYPCAVQGPCLGSARDHLPAWEGAFASMFLHASWLHLLGNMLFLWIFGNNVEDALGRLRFLFFYFAAGLAATTLQAFVTLHYAGNAAASVPNVGASGAIAGVLGAYIVLYPTAMVLTLVGFFILPVPAFFFLGIWFGLQVIEGGLGLTQPNSGGGVAFFAHVGGFVFGLVTVRLLANWRPVRTI
jgi:membrane associated rhomboid family serine protease